MEVVANNVTSMVTALRAGRHNYNEFTILLESIII